ncbi:TrkA C-terminal domain-containing protein, partial [uncultured Duncaniella sp.]
YPIVVAVSVITTFTTPYFIRMADPACDFVESHLPKRLHFLIDRYTKDATTSASATKQLWSSLFKRYLWRVVLYSMVLIALCIISLDYLRPMFVGLFPSWGRFITTVVALVIMSPFLLAMTYPASKKTERERLIAANAKYDVPLIIMTIVRLLIAMVILVYLLSSIYSMTVGWTIGVGLFLILALSFSKSAHKRMVRIESRFMDNLNERELRRSGAKNRLVPNMHLAYMTVGYKCPFVGEQLKNSGLRGQFGVSVSSIQRGGKMIMVPGADERVFPGDVLGVIGTDDEIQKLLPVVEANEDEASDTTQTDVKLTGIRLKANSPLIGKTIAGSDFRNVWEALLVAVQRGEDYLQPDASIIFAEDDTVWVVGNLKRIEAIAG